MPTANSCGLPSIPSTLLKCWKNWRNRKSHESKDERSYGLQNLQTVTTLETATSSATSPTSPIRSNSSGRVVAAPSLVELQRTAQPRTSPRATPSPVLPATRSLQDDTSAPKSRPRHIPIAEMYPSLGNGQPLSPVPEASVAGPPKNPPPVNPAYAAARAQRQRKAVEQGDTDTDFLLEDDEDNSTIVTDSNADPGSIVVQRPSREEELARKLSVLRNPPGVEIANLPGQDNGWEDVGIAPLTSPPISNRSLKLVPNGEPVVAAPFDPHHPPRRSSVDGLRYLNKEHSLYWEQPDCSAPSRPPRRSSLEWTVRQEKLQRQLTPDRLRPQREQDRLTEKKPKSFSDWVQDRASLTIVEENEGEEGEEQQRQQGPILLQPSVYSPPTSKQKGKAKIGSENGVRSQESNTLGLSEGRLNSPLPPIPPRSPLLPPAPVLAPRRSAKEFVRMKEKAKGPKLYDGVSQSDSGKF